jgi:hypothetical protein
VLDVPAMLPERPKMLPKRPKMPKDRPPMPESSTNLVADGAPMKANGSQSRFLDSGGATTVSDSASALSELDETHTPSPAD